MQRVPLGQLELTILSDGTLQFPGNVFFSNVDPSEWRDLPGVEPDGTVIVGHNMGVLRNVDRLIVMDTGYGDQTHDGKTGHFLEEFDRASFSREQVTDVLNSHAHGDHVGGNTVSSDGEARPSFPEAQYHIGRGDWDHFGGERGGMPGFDRHLGVLAQANMLDLVDAAVDIANEVSFVATPGHTPGHHSVLMGSGGQLAIFLGDVCHHPLHFSHPDWVTEWDTNPELTPRTRRAVFRAAAESDALIICPHAPYPGLGKLRRSGEEFEWNPIAPS